MQESELILQMREVLSEGFDPMAAELANAVLELHRQRELLVLQLEEISNAKISAPTSLYPTELCRCKG